MRTPGRLLSTKQHRAKSSMGFSWGLKIAVTTQNALTASARQELPDHQKWMFVRLGPSRALPPQVGGPSLRTPPRTSPPSAAKRSHSQTGTSPNKEVKVLKQGPAWLRQTRNSDSHPPLPGSASPGPRCEQCLSSPAGQESLCGAVVLLNPAVLSLRCA